MQVYAKTDESDVGGIRPGQEVTFKVDAFPKETFRGHVSQVRMNPTTVQNVTTYDTIVDFDNPDTKLFPGMTAYVTIPVSSATDVLRVSNMALRYKPDLDPKKLAELCQQYKVTGPSCGGRGEARAAAPEELETELVEAGADKAKEQVAEWSGSPEAMPKLRDRVTMVAAIRPYSGSSHSDNSLEPVKIRPASRTVPSPRSRRSCRVS